MLCDICGKPFDPIKGMFLCNPRVHEGEEMPRFYVLEERVYLNGKRNKVVSQDSPEAAYFLGPVGHTIPYEDAEKLGLVEQEDHPKTSSEELPNAEAQESSYSLSERAIALLHNAGYSDPSQIRHVDDAALLAIDGVGPSMLKDYREVYPYAEPEQPKVEPEESKKVANKARDENTALSEESDETES